MRSASQLAVSADGEYFATFERHSALVWPIKAATKARDPLRLHHTKSFTCIALGSKGDSFAAGDASGRIRIWHDLNAAVAAPEVDSKQVKCTTVHWHANPVGCVAFTEDGKYLLSGGAEGVLVIWQLDTGVRQYLPRLGAPLRTLALSPADPSIVTVGLADNAQHILNFASMTIKSSIRGIQPANLSGDENPSGTLSSSRLLRLHPRQGYAVLSATGACLQFIDAIGNQSVMRLQVASRNYVAQPHQSPAFSEPAVLAAAFSRDGATLVTLDTRPTGALSHKATDSCLRFWELRLGETSELAVDGSGNAPYVLTTCVNDPHLKGVLCTVGLDALKRGVLYKDITALEYHPFEHLVVTTSLDKEFKIWQRAPEKGGGAWSIRSVASYGDEPLHSAAFSPDGSLLAIGGMAITLWDAHHHTHSATLVPPPGQPGAVKTLTFVASSPFLVVATKDTLMTWNLLTLSVMWSYSLNITSLATHPTLPQFAVSVSRPSAAAPKATGRVETPVPAAPAGKKAKGKKAKGKDASEYDFPEEEEEDAAEAAAGEREAPASFPEPRATSYALLFDAAQSDPLAAWGLRDSAISAMAFLNPQLSSKVPIASEASLLVLTQ
eukprot:gene14559-17208_t